LNKKHNKPTNLACLPKDKNFYSPGSNNLLLVPSKKITTTLTQTVFYHPSFFKEIPE
jgi:hypothetical protein